MVVTDADGTVIIQPEPSAQTEPGTTGPLGPCDDNSYSFLNTNGYFLRWTHNPTFYYNPTFSRGEYTQAQYTSAIVNGETHMSRGDNSCGITQDPTVAGVYAGTISRNPDFYLINDQPYCLNSADTDNYNIVAWAAYGYPDLAVTCTMGQSNGTIRSADIIINTHYRFSTGSLTGCSGSTADLEAVMTHEFGHFYGLDHSGENGQLTMNQKVTYCSAAARSLGLGDMSGMNVFY